jgi:galactokinase/mevalonate kinase-like predicted kinase
VRIDLAGGWSDTPPYCISFGGKVINLAVNLNGQPPIQAFARLNNDSKIVLRSIDLGQECVISDYSEIEDYRNIGNAFSIPKAALVLCGFSSRSGYKSLKEQLYDFGGGLDLTFLAAVPKGSGLGTSSILAACILNVLSEAGGFKWDKFTLSEKTLVLEQMLTTGGGWQDQIGGIFRGLKFIETFPGFEQTPRIKTLPDYLFKDPEYKQTVLLYYTGITRVAKNILDEIVKGMFLNAAERLSVLEKIRSHAEQLYEICLYGERRKIAEAVKQTWIYNTILDSGTNPPQIQKIISLIDKYSDGYKLTGAGGGGYMLIFAKSPECALKIRKILSDNAPMPGARFVDFSLSDTGIQITRS